MSEQDKLFIATKAFDKGWGYETIKYCDYLYGHEEDVEAVWDYLDELKDIGHRAFYEKYKEFNLY